MLSVVDRIRRRRDHKMKAKVLDTPNVVGISIRTSSSSHELNQTRFMNEPKVVVSSDGSEQVCVGVPKRVVSVSTAPEDQLRRIDIIICNHRSSNDVSTTRLSKSSREGPYQFTRTRL